LSHGAGSRAQKKPANEAGRIRFRSRAIPSVRYAASGDPGGRGRWIARLTRRSSYGGPGRPRTGPPGRGEPGRDSGTTATQPVNEVDAAVGAECDGSGQVGPQRTLDVENRTARSDRVATTRAAGQGVPPGLASSRNRQARSRRAASRWTLARFWALEFWRLVFTAGLSSATDRLTWNRRIGRGRRRISDTLQVAAWVSVLVRTSGCGGGSMAVA